MRATQRICDVAKKTVERLLVSAGGACVRYQDEVMRNLKCNRLQIDEIWSFTYCKQANVPRERMFEDIGDTWTWVAMDSDTKLVPAFHIGRRTADVATHFCKDHKRRKMTESLTKKLEALEVKDPEQLTKLIQEINKKPK